QTDLPVVTTSVVSGDWSAVCLHLDFVALDRRYRCIGQISWNQLAVFITDRCEFLNKNGEFSVFTEVCGATCLRLEQAEGAAGNTVSISAAVPVLRYVTGQLNAIDIDRVPVGGALVIETATGGTHGVSDVVGVVTAEVFFAELCCIHGEGQRIAV